MWCSVAQQLNRNVTIAAVGEPGANKVYVYASVGWPTVTSWILEATIAVPQATLPQHRFGERGTIGQYNDLLVVGE